MARAVRFPAQERNPPLDRSLSALIAVRNAQSTLRAAAFEMLDVMPELTSRFELVIIDDCSTDATIEVADELAAVYPQLFAVRHSIPLGHAAAIRTGIDRSLGEVIFFADENCGLPLNQVRRLWTALGQYDLVMGYPAGLDDSPDAIHGLACPSGGCQMGYRRVLRGVADSLGDPTSFLASLRRSGVSWHEIGIGNGVPWSMHRFSPLAPPRYAGRLKQASAEP